MNLNWTQYPSGMSLASPTNDIAYSIDQLVLRRTGLNGMSEEIGRGYADLDAAKAAAQADFDKQQAPPAATPTV